MSTISALPFNYAFNYAEAAPVYAAAKPAWVDHNQIAFEADDGA